MNKRQRKKAFKKWLDGMANSPGVKQLSKDLLVFSSRSVHDASKLLRDAMIMDNPFGCSRVPFLSDLIDELNNNDSIETISVMKHASCGPTAVILNDNIVLPKSIDGVTTILVHDSDNIELIDKK